MTACTAPRFGDHDYSQPAHNTPADPRDAEDNSPCQAQSAAGPPWCQHERRYGLVVYQIGSHEWIRLYACVPCTATLRQRHRTNGPGGTCGIARITEVQANEWSQVKVSGEVCPVAVHRGRVLTGKMAP